MPIAARVLAVGLVLVSACSADSGGSSPSPSGQSVPAASTESVPVASTESVLTAPAGDGRAAVLEAALARYGSPGVIAVVLDGDDRWALALGDADVSGTPASTDQTFRAASITKPVIAALAVRLAEAGTVDLDAPVGLVVPASVLRPDPPVTIRQLLAHTGGIFNVGDEGDLVADFAAISDADLREQALAFLAAAADDPSVVVPPEVSVAAAETHDRYGPPGDVYHYSNAGYQLAGMAIERVAGRSLADLLAEQIVEPLGLSSTALAPADRTLPRFRGYETASADGSRVDAAEELRAFGNGANGGLLTTADDLARLFSALLGGELVTAEHLAEMQRPTLASMRVNTSYGLGLARYTLTCGTFYGHEGGVSGTASIAMADPSGDRVVVIAFNQRGIGDPRLPALADELVCGSDG